MASSKKPIRIVIGKVGCDIHERGIYALMQAFRDKGMEVVYTGRYQTPEAVVKTAIEESAHVIALSDHTGSMRYIAGDIMAALKKYKADNICVVAGGLIPPQDIPILEKMGVTGNYGPGTPLDVIVNHVVSRVEKAAQSPSDRGKTSHTTGPGTASDKASTG
jgi:methylmalonyl-CoA mutase C-terminal domain/subunit